MGLASRVASLFSRNVEKGYALPSSGGLGDLLSGVYAGSPREPFTGAWQEGIREASAMGPNVFANSTVFSCMNIISSDIAVLPPEVLQMDTNGIRSVHIKHPYTSLFQNPNFYQTQLQFVQDYIVSKLRSGNTYVLLLRDARYVVNEMFVLNPNHVQPLIADDGSIYYRLGRDVMAGVGESFTVPARDILHDRVMPLFHPLVGVSPLFAACMDAMIAGRIQLNTENFFANMARTSGVLVAPGKIEKTVARALQTEWEANYSGKGIGRTAVLSNGLEYKPMAPLTAVESEMIAVLRWTVERIAQVYRVPAYKIGEMNKATYRNSEQQARDYVKDCLGYHIRAFEQSFNKALGLSGGIEVRFNLDELFRMEKDMRYTTHAEALKSGFKTINEVRYEEDLPPVANGDKPRVQMQSVPLELADALAAATIAGKFDKPKPPASAPAPKTIESADTEKQFELDLLPDPVQLDLLVAAFGENFDLGEHNGA